MAYDKAELIKAGLAEINDPELTLRVRSGDPTILQPLYAVAQMMAMVSTQADLGLTEYWTRARDSFVVADAAARGILPFGTSARAEFEWYYSDGTGNPLTVGRRLLDAKNRVWTVSEITYVNSRSGTGVITQYDEKSTRHTVAESRDFYDIPLPAPDNNQSLVDVSLYLIDAATGERRLFTRCDRYENAEAGDKIFSVAGDEKLNLYIRFGVANIAGYVPSAGTVFEIVTRQSHGEVKLDPGSILEPEYIATGEENLKIYFAQITVAAAPPPSVEIMRELARFPYLYDNNAVYLGEFTRLVWHKLQPFVFLSVWNERLEEKLRGSNVDNINTLFVSFIKEGVETSQQKQEWQEKITAAVHEADDSYKVKFKDPILIELDLNVWLYLAEIHDQAEVGQKVKDYILQNYGYGSKWAQRGGHRLMFNEMAQEIKRAVPELNDGKSDIVLHSKYSHEYAEYAAEFYCYVSEDILNDSHYFQIMTVR